MDTNQVKEALRKFQESKFTPEQKERIRDAGFTLFSMLDYIVERVEEDPDVPEWLQVHAVAAKSVLETLRGA